MNETIERLLEHAETVPVQPEPASEDDVLTAQEAVFLPFPADYREFLLEAAHLVIGEIEPCQTSDATAHTYLPEVAALAWDNGVDRHLLPICRHGERYYCMQPDGEIMAWVDGALGDKVWESIWEWAEDVWLGDR